MKLPAFFFAFVICRCVYSQDTTFVKSQEEGRYVNVSGTNFEVRAFELIDEVITFETLSIPRKSYVIVAREGNIMMAEHPYGVYFFELKKNRIIYYQRIELKASTIEGYRKGKRKVKNVFKRVRS